MLEDLFAPRKSLTSRIELIGTGQGFSHTYHFFNVDPTDNLFSENWGDYDIDVKAKLQCGEVSFFAECYLMQEDR